MVDHGEIWKVGRPPSGLQRLPSETKSEVVVAGNSLVDSSIRQPAHDSGME